MSEGKILNLELSSFQNTSIVVQILFLDDMNLKNQTPVLILTTLSKSDMPLGAKMQQKCILHCFVKQTNSGQF